MSANNNWPKLVLVGPPRSNASSQLSLELSQELSDTESDSPTPDLNTAADKESNKQPDLGSDSLTTNSSSVSASDNQNTSSISNAKASKSKSKVREKKQQVVVVEDGYEVDEDLAHFYVYKSTSFIEEEKNAYVVTLTCIKCQKDIRAPPKNRDNYFKHLKVIHKIEVVKKRPIKIPIASTKISRYFKHASSDIKYDPIKQKDFEQSVCDMICVDGLPLNFVTGLGFKNLSARLMPDVKILTPPTIKKRIAKYVSDHAIPELTEDFQAQPNGSVHISADIWTSSNLESILAAKTHYIDKNWELKSKSIGFVSFSGHHTGERIKDKLHELILNRNLTKEQLGALVTDNAANMTKAANLSEFFDDKWAVAFNNSCGEPVSTDEEGVGRSDSSDVEELSQESNIGCTFEDDEDADLLFEDELLDVEPEEICGKYQHKYGCSCHKLQLAVNDAIKKCQNVRDVVNTMNKVIVFFRRSPLKTGELREICPHDLIKVGITRWNSIVNAMDRFCEDGVFTQLQQLLLKYEVEENSKLPPPKYLDRTKMRELIKILHPPRRATDILQGNFVTSSRLLVTLEKCLRDLNDLQLVYFENFRDRLVENIISRFKQSAEDPTFWIATFLDPRSSAAFFTSARSLCLVELPVVIKAVRDRMPPSPESEVRTVRTTEESNSPTNNPVPVKKRRLPNEDTKAGEDDFNFFNPTLELEPPKDEIQRFLELRQIKQYSRMYPMQFWTENENTLPILAALARIFLAMPASSGDVERVFSITGNLKRARRAKLKPNVVQDMLLYRQHRERKLRSESVVVTLPTTTV